MKTLVKNDGPELRANLMTGFISGALLGIVFGLGFGSILLGLVVGVALGLVLGYIISRRELPMRYPLYLVRRMLLTGSLFLATLLVYNLAEGMALGANRIWAVLLPTLGGSLFIYSIGAALASLDEMQRRIR